MNTMKNYFFSSDSIFFDFTRILLFTSVMIITIEMRIRAMPMNMTSWGLLLNRDISTSLFISGTVSVCFSPWSSVLSLKLSNAFETLSVMLPPSGFRRKLMRSGIKAIMKSVMTMMTICLIFTFRLSRNFEGGLLMTT